MSINSERLLARIDEFARIGATPAGGVNRQALSIEDRAARSLLAGLALARGFKVFQDPMANLFIRREGRRPDLPPILIGSHLDSQPTGGRFDGALGTLTAFEVMESLADAGIVTEAPLEVVAWTNEEGSRFAPGTMGSMAFAAGEIPAAWDAIRDDAGISLKDALQATLAALPEAQMRPLGHDIACYVELHIEQGPSLEQEGIPIGIVHGIQGTRWLEATITGQAAHAGTTALKFRHDPMVAVVKALGRLNAGFMPKDERARFTVGRFTVEPGSINAIPGSVTFSMDIRHPDSAVINAMEDEIRAVCADAAAGEGCNCDMKVLFDMAPAVFSDRLLAYLDKAAERLRLPKKRMLSGAFHDALFVNRVAPAVMIFVPCRDGLSHNEAEYVEPEHCIIGARMLYESTMEAMTSLTCVR